MLRRFISTISQIIVSCTLLIPSSLFAQSLTPVTVKQIAAPPSDMVSGLLALPDPASIPVVSRSALIPVKHQLIDGQWKWTLPIKVLPRGARIVLLPTVQDSWLTHLVSLNQTVISTEILKNNVLTTDPLIEIGTDVLAWVAPDREFAHLSILPDNAGSWILTILSDYKASGFVLIDAGPEYSLSTYIESLETIQNQPITLVSSLSDDVRLTSLIAEITTPNGDVVTESANTGSSSITFFPTEHGSYSVRVTAKGVDSQGNQILLTTQHLVYAAEPAPLLKSPAVVELENHVQFSFSPSESTRRTILAAEVWGKSDGVFKPVSWISTIVGSERALLLDKRWIALAGVSTNSLELRKVRLHDIDSFVPIELIERIPTPINKLSLPKSPLSITQDMLTGSVMKTVPTPVPPQIVQSVGPGHRLMMIHGYCTDANPFPLSHFSGDLAVFEDFNQSRTHDQFALNILAQSAPMKSFGVVAHSQGGNASLHLLNFYWSGLDWSDDGNRRIQTVGSPYQGTALAGNAAVLGNIFGFGCGENESLNYTGSANWLSLIPSAPRQQVYFHTTSFEDGFGFDYCNIITDLLLSDPDDGVIERSAGQLSSANNMGHLEDWCHTTGMRDPAQCTDVSRNTIMNQEAKR